MASRDPAAEAPAGHAAKRDAQPAHRACPHYTSSPAGMAWPVGAWLRKTGAGDPRVWLADAAALVRVP